MLDARHRVEPLSHPGLRLATEACIPVPVGQEFVASGRELWENSGARLGVVYVLENVLLKKPSGFGFSSLPFSFRDRLRRDVPGCRWGADVPSGTGAGHAAADAHD